MNPYNEQALCVYTGYSSNYYDSTQEKTGIWYGRQAADMRQKVLRDC